MSTIRLLILSGLTWANLVRGADAGVLNICQQWLQNCGLAQVKPNEIPIALTRQGTLDFYSNLLKSFHWTRDRSAYSWNGSFGAGRAHLDVAIKDYGKFLFTIHDDKLKENLRLIVIAVKRTWDEFEGRPDFRPEVLKRMGGGIDVGPTASSLAALVFLDKLKSTFTELQQTGSLNETFSFEEDRRLQDWYQSAIKGDVLHPVFKFEDLFPK
jgi:hypothetical protein